MLCVRDVCITSILCASTATERRQSSGRSASTATRPATQVRTAPSSWQLKRGMAVKMQRSADLRMQRMMQSRNPAQSLKPQGISLQALAELCLQGAIPTALKYRQAATCFVMCCWLAAQHLPRQDQSNIIKAGEKGLLIGRDQCSLQPC